METDGDTKVTRGHFHFRRASDEFHGQLRILPRGRRRIHPVEEVCRDDHAKKQTSSCDGLLT